jgi:hypothetical protein
MPKGMDAAEEQDSEWKKRENANNTAIKKTNQTSSRLHFRV